MKVLFVDANRESYGVEPICRVLPIVPSTYYEQKAREKDPSRQPARAKRDVQLCGEIRRVRQENFDVYGVRKVWRQLRRATTSLTAGIALDALEQALHERRLDPEDPLVHHSDRGVQYVSIRYTERLAETGIEPSVGSRGDSYDNALAESIIGLYKTEVIRRRGPWRGLEDVEFATLEWVHWYNTQRLLEPIGNVAPVLCQNSALLKWVWLFWNRENRPFSQ